MIVLAVLSLTPAILAGGAVWLESRGHEDAGSYGWYAFLAFVTILITLSDVKT